MLLLITLASLLISLAILGTLRGLVLELDLLEKVVCFLLADRVVVLPNLACLLRVPSRRDS